jgi:hypothetical protein
MAIEPISGEVGVRGSVVDVQRTWMAAVGIVLALAAFGMAALAVAPSF